MSAARVGATGTELTEFTELNRPTAAALRTASSEAEYTSRPSPAKLKITAAAFSFDSRHPAAGRPRGWDLSLDYDGASGAPRSRGQNGTIDWRIIAFSHITYRPCRPRLSASCRRISCTATAPAPFPVPRRSRQPAQPIFRAAVGHGRIRSGRPLQSNCRNRPACPASV